MELVAWRLENEADPRIGDEVEPDLVRRARCSAGDRAGKAPVDCAVQVAAQDAFDLGMACDDFGKSRGIVEAEIVHVGNARREWRVMHQDHGRPIELRRECSVEPTQSLGAQHPTMLTGDERVERDKPYWVIFDRELQVALCRGTCRNRRTPSPSRTHPVRPPAPHNRPEDSGLVTHTAVLDEWPGPAPSSPGL